MRDLNKVIEHYKEHHGKWLVIASIALSLLLTMIWVEKCKWPDTECYKKIEQNF